jgi:hypothetical protein
MASYYTYGTIPNAEETVYGPLSQGYAEGGEVDEAVPADRGLPEELYYSEEPQIYYSEEPQPYYSEEPQPLAMAQPRNDQVAAPYIPPGLQAAFLRMQGKSPEQLAAKAEAAAKTKTEREVLSGLLQSNQFDAAFKYAMDNNVQNLLIDPTELRTLKSNFTPEETKKFFAEMPKDLMGPQSEEEVKFDPAAGLEASLEKKTIPSGLSALGLVEGVPQVQRAFIPLEQKKEDGLFEDIIKTVLAAGTLYAGASALPGLIGGGSAAGAGTAGTAGASGAGATGGGLSGAIKAVGSIPAKIGGTIAETLGLPVTSTVGKAALGNAVITGGTTAAKGGSLEDVLKAGLLSAGLTYVSAPVMDGLKDAAKAVGGKLGIGTGAATTAAGQAATEALSDVAVDDLLQQVTVTASRPALSNLIGLGAVAVPTSTKVDLPEPKVATEQVAPEIEEPPLEEVVVTSQRPGLENLLGLGTVALPTTTPVTTPRPSVLEPEPVVADREVREEPIEQQPLEEVTVTAQRPPLSDLLGLGAVAVPTTTPVETPKPDYIEEVVLPEEEPLEEVVVTGQRPPLSDLLGLGAVAVPTTTPVDVKAPDYIEDVVIPEEEPLEEVVVTGQRPPLSDLLGLGAVAIPTTTPVDVRKPDYIEDVVLPEEEPLEEVVVTGQRPPLSDLLGLGAVAVPTTTPVDLPKPEVILDQIVYPEEVVVEGTKPTEGGLTLPPFTIPTQTPIEGIKEPEINKPNPLKDLLDKYGSLENLLKLLGALGSAASGTAKAPAPTAPTGGMGGALPKYTYTRQQLSPDIDYYTYGTRPEAKFFDYTTQLERPVQPELPPAKTPDQESPVVSLAAPTYVGPTPLFVEPGMATGGLTGYAKGGSKSSRYVDGPGSGREDKIPALLSDGEYVIDAETLALLGDGSTKEGARRMDKFRANIRKHKGRALSRGRISPNAKSPDKYMGGGLT